MQLFDVPPSAVPAAAEPSFPLGGLGGGHFVWDDKGAFREWRFHPGLPAIETVQAANSFHVWWNSRDGAGSLELAGDAVQENRRLFPITWRRYTVRSLPSDLHALVLESASFSPLLPGDGYERSLPIHVIAFRARNETQAPMEVALMLTWACGSPDGCGKPEYDFQHDNLCLTGSLGEFGSAARQGIAVPDLHYVGAYQQGIQPWGDVGEVVAEFAEYGELDELADRGDIAGAAAWLKFDLRPGETKEAPFVLAWHYPVYESGQAAGMPRHYTQYLGRYRPDNAIVWLAEQAFQHFGAETANYRYWYQALRDWQDASGDGADLNILAELLREDVTWVAERQIDTSALSDNARARLIGTNGRNVWPDLDIRG